MTSVPLVLKFPTFCFWPLCSPESGADFVYSRNMERYKWGIVAVNLEKSFWKCSWSLDKHKVFELVHWWSCLCAAEIFFFPLRLVIVIDLQDKICLSYVSYARMFLHNNANCYVIRRLPMKGMVNRFRVITFIHCAVPFLPSCPL